MGFYLPPSFPPRIKGSYCLKEYWLFFFHSRSQPPEVVSNPSKWINDNFTPFITQAFESQTTTAVSLQCLCFRNSTSLTQKTGNPELKANRSLNALPPGSPPLPERPCSQDCHWQQHGPMDGPEISTLREDQTTANVTRHLWHVEANFTRTQGNLFTKQERPHRSQDQIYGQQRGNLERGRRYISWGLTYTHYCVSNR